MTQPWTEAETRRLGALARKKVSAQDIAKSLGRHSGFREKEGARIRHGPVEKDEGNEKIGSYGRKYLQQPRRS